MIVAPSLIPAPRLVRRKVRLRVRGWTGVVVLAGLLGGAGVAAVSRWTQDPQAASPLHLAQAEQRLASQTAKRDALRAEAASAAATLHAVLAATSHADWSILLAYIAKLCGEDITLGNLVLEPEPGESGFDLRIEGEGRSQKSIAAFVLGLERSGVFSETRLENSGGARAGSGIPFSVTCLIRPDSPGDREKVGGG